MQKVAVISFQPGSWRRPARRRWPWRWTCSPEKIPAANRRKFCTTKIPEWNWGRPPTPARWPGSPWTLRTEGRKSEPSSELCSRRETLSWRRFLFWLLESKLLLDLFVTSSLEFESADHQKWLNSRHAAKKTVSQKNVERWQKTDLSFRSVPAAVVVVRPSVMKPLGLGFRPPHQSRRVSPKTDADVDDRRRVVPKRLRHPRGGVFRSVVLQ